MRITPNVYQVKLSLYLKLNPTFHVSVLKPFYLDKKDPHYNETTITTFHEQEINEILAHKFKLKKGTHPGY